MPCLGHCLPGFQLLVLYLLLLSQHCFLEPVLLHFLLEHLFMFVGAEEHTYKEDIEVVHPYVEFLFVFIFGFFIFLCNGV